MNTINRVRITINGVHYTISTSEPEEYVLGLAQELDEQIKASETALADMIDELTGSEFDMKGLSEFQSLVKGE